MYITVKFLATLRDLVGCSEYKVEVDKEVAVLELIDTLSRVFGESFRRAVLDYEDNNVKVKDYVKILVNGRNIEFLDGLKTIIKSGDVVYFIPPAGGG